MFRTSTAHKAKFRICPSALFGLFVLTLGLLSAGCSKGPAGSESAEKNSNSANANQLEQARAAQPLLRPTITGDIERAALAVAMSRDAVKLDNWQEGISQLQAARKEVEVALTRPTNLRAEFESLRSAIDQAITILEGRGKESDARLADLQTRIGTLKVQASSAQ